MELGWNWKKIWKCSNKMAAISQNLSLNVDELFCVIIDPSNHYEFKKKAINNINKL